ncbi:MAG: hypothetical protein MAG795_00492 [Candidatus Woesearchaeota archaeon]|nr:hypothetical protein [Candidatus Woesearchaeota archaeon]
MDKFLKEFRNGLKQYSALINTLTNVILLSIVYIIGVGLTWLIGKIFGKQFLYLGKKKSYWTVFKKSKNHYKQF